jgi:hypothetical protein
MAAERQLADWRPTQRHLYLGTVGTVPAMRGLGLARRTLAPTLSFADVEGVPAFLETSSESNIDFYSTLQFEVIDHRRIDDGGPDVWAMLRAPQTMNSGVAGPARSRRRFSGHGFTWRFGSVRHYVRPT